MSDGTLTLYGVTVVWDGVPLGGEVRAYDEAMRAKAGDLDLIERLSLAVLNYRRPASEEAYTLDDLRALPLNGDTVTSLRAVVDAIQAVMKGEVMGRTVTTATRRPRRTGGASGSASPATGTPR